MKPNKGMGTGSTRGGDQNRRRIAGRVALAESQLRPYPPCSETQGKYSAQKPCAYRRLGARKRIRKNIGGGQCLRNS